MTQSNDSPQALDPQQREEPQSERGEKGSRDEGGPPGAGPANRPAGDPHSDDQATGVNVQDTALPEMDPQPTGDGGG